MFYYIQNDYFFKFQFCMSVNGSRTYIRSQIGEGYGDWLKISQSSDVTLKYSNGKVLYYDSSSSSWKELSIGGGGGMPTLDYANPLYTFSASGTYTATQDCYLLGSLYSVSDGVSISINGNKVFGNYAKYAGSTYVYAKISKDDIITFTANNTMYGALNIFKEK